MTKDERRLSKKYASLSGMFDEARKRLWAAAEARELGRGGITCLAKVTGLSRPVIYRGLNELKEKKRERKRLTAEGRIRLQGGGRKPVTETDPELLNDLEALVEPMTRGDPGSPLRWTCKSTTKLAADLNRKQYRVRQRTVHTLLTELDYSLQSTRKAQEGKQHPDRNAQFEHINMLVKEFQKKNEPVISVDTKKKELVGNYANNGQEWQPKGKPEKVQTHDFPDKKLGKVAPYGVYDVTTNQGWVSVGINHDTAEFAVETIRRWWHEMGSVFYPKATKLLITADSGGSNGSRIRLWKLALQQFAKEVGLKISVSHFPPGTSKWNKIEHRMFCHITQNWRDRPLTSRRVVVNLIGNTTTNRGLKIKAALDINIYEKGLKVSDQEMAAINIQRDKFHGDWNYSILP